MPSSQYLPKALLSAEDTEIKETLPHPQDQKTMRKGSWHAGPGRSQWVEEGPGCFIQGVKEGSPWKQHTVAWRVHGVCQVAWGTETLDEGPKSSPRPRDTHQDPLRRSRQTLPLHCPLTSVEAYGAHLPTKNSNRKATAIQVPDIQSTKLKFCFPV